MQTWQMQDAKARMSELVKSAQTQPQDITVHGKSVAVVVSRGTFNRLSQAQGSLVNFMQRSPLTALDVADDVVFERDTSLTRRTEDWRVLSYLVSDAGRPPPAIDSLLAATALTHDLVLVTRKTGDFGGVPVQVFNPWSDR